MASFNSGSCSRVSSLGRCFIVAEELGIAHLVCDHIYVIVPGGMNQAKMQAYMDRHKLGPLFEVSAGRRTMDRYVGNGDAFTAADEVCKCLRSRFIY